MLFLPINSYSIFHNHTETAGSFTFNLHLKRTKTMTFIRLLQGFGYSVQGTVQGRARPGQVCPKPAVHQKLKTDYISKGMESLPLVYTLLPAPLLLFNWPQR